MDELNEIAEVEQQVETLETEVKKFADGLPYWAKFICSEILSGNELTEDKYESAFSYLLEELDLKEKGEKPVLSISYNPNASDDFKANIIFNSLSNIEGVNALAENQSIELTENLTIIYGSNGAGKSGYVRLLKNVFYSKDREPIEPNIHLDNGHKPIKADFQFTTDEGALSLKYPDDVGNGVFNQFAVFDGEIGRRHLKYRNDFKFRPAGLRLFNEFNTALENLNSRLITEIRTKNIANPFADEDIFQGESEIKTFLSSLSHNSKLEDLKKHLPFTEEEKTKKTEIEKKYDDLKISLSQKDKALKELRNIKTQLAARKKNLETINLWFTQNQLNTVKNSIADCKTKEETAQKEGSEKFKTDKIKNIGSPEWKQFIEAAEKYAITQKENGVEYPEIGDSCLLCQQSINEDAPKKLIASYWAYIKSVAEQEAKTAKENLDKIKKDYNDLNLNQFPETDTLTAWLNEKYEADLTLLKEGLEKQKTLAERIVANIIAKDSKAEIEFQLGLTGLEKIETEIDKDIKAFEEDEQNKVLADLLKQKTYLAHKEKLSLRFTDIENLHKNLIWENKADKFNKQWYKTQSTNTEKRLSKQYFNADYIKSFNEECEKLEGKFGIEIDARSSDAQSNRQLFLKGKDPSAILSEGEQKVIALADFIAESTITTINKGIVFDDPVTSLDEERKKVIAKRICELSQSKQVLLFTHDLVFVSALINYCTDFQIPYRCHSIENLEEPGKIFPDNTPSHEAKYKTSAEARRYIKLAKDADPEIREAFIKSGFAALRSSYEAFVIFELFCGAVKRFDDRVSIDSLKGLHVDDSLVKEIMDNFKLCCRYMEGHIHSDKYLAAKPQLKHLQEEADRFDTMRPKLDKLKKEHGKK
ncbi:AAA family ATPase [Empedobacter falsenii]|uniref:AAA family ATPase n=1 Tax=Empedobacter falsenii TaxID=343874 RepID=UPI001C59E717|nr:AAA family ATPase [Empedobacter falsenii]MBW1619459.1 AAA family ATPase [Empedobacter falsenii]